MSAVSHPLEESREADPVPPVEDLAQWSERVERDQTLSRELVSVLGRAGYLGATIDRRYGGRELPPRETGALHEELARVHGSIENLLTVTSMSVAALQRFAPAALAAEWLPRVATGQSVVAFAVTEPRAESAVADVETQLHETVDGWRMTGEKLWISFGQIADAFVVLARIKDRTQAVFVPREAAGLEVRAAGHMLGLRGNALARVSFRDCHVPYRNAVGRSFTGLAPPILFGLDIGRFLTAWGSVGLAQGALDAAATHARSHVAGGKRIGEHQLVQKMLTESIVAVKGARLLCEAAADARQAAAPEMIGATLIAKYAASRAARLATDHAVQILGARGCAEATPVARYFRDARMMEIIEGTTQIHEIEIAGDYLSRSGAGTAHA